MQVNKKEGNMEINRGLLKRHVTESNAIENIFVRENHHLFMDHFAAAEFVVKSARDRGVVATPEEIHSILMRRELPDAGKIRTVRVWVGLHLKPRPEDAEKLMGQWKNSLQKDIRSGSLLTPEQKEKLAWHYHHWFEAIHPFRDGNGRTGRLILNNIRLLLGLSWLIVSFVARAQYYDSIRRWEAEHIALLNTE
jgi:fido (protein-threonine AMPylation protein)